MTRIVHCISIYGIGYDIIAVNCVITLLLTIKRRRKLFIARDATVQICMVKVTFLWGDGKNRECSGTCAI